MTTLLRPCLALICMFGSTPSSFAAAQLDEEHLVEVLEAATDGYEVGQASRDFADARSVEAMEARVELFDEKLDIRGGVHLRDWLYTGMLRAASVDELEVLAEAAASRKSSPLLRLVCLRAIRRSSASIESDLLLDKDFRKLEGELSRAWQATCGEVLASGRLVEGSNSKAANALRDALLENGMPFLGHRRLQPSTEELSTMMLGFKGSKSGEDRAQFLYVLAPHAAANPSVREAYAQAVSSALASRTRAELVACWASAVEHHVVDATPLLITALEQLEQLDANRHTKDYAAALRNLTGQQLGASSEAWQRWWKRDGETWLEQARTKRPSDRENPDPTEDDETVSTYFGIPVDSDRIGFVLDGSGSMNDELEDGTRCADAAVAELVQFLDRFPASGILNLRVIVREAQSPFKEPVPASKKNRTKAIRFVERFDFGPASAMYDVLLEAQQDPEIDTLLFVSDGGGSWGSFAFSGHMLDGLRLAYERSGVRIHCICVGKDRNKARFMEQLADLTSGRMKKI